jgi:hypothetical protein
MVMVAESNSSNSQEPLDALVQEELFSVETPLVEQTAASEPGKIVAPVVDLRERAKFLGKSLSHMAIVSRSNGYSKAIYTSERSKIAAHTKYPDVDELDQGVKFTKAQELKRAKQTFLSAYNMALDEPVTLNDPDFQIAFAEFGYKYGVGGNKEQTARKSTARAKYRKVLGIHKSIEGDLAPQTYEISSEDPTETVSTEDTAPIEEKTPELADTKRKLIGLRDDTRAGFLPTTHTEKNQGFELLDYMGNPKYPSGANRRLEEIFIHQQKVARSQGRGGRDIYDMARDSVRSVLNEWGDHLHGAIQSHDELTELKELLNSGFRPDLSLIEVTEPDGAKTYDYNALVRFANLKAYREGKPLPHDPLRTRQDRSVVHPDKNKIIEDDYTAVGNLSDIQSYIDEAAATLSVKSGRELIDEAITDQATRRLFWYRALKSIDSKEGFGDIADRVLGQAMRSTTNPAA